MTSTLIRTPSDTQHIAAELDILITECMPAIKALQALRVALTDEQWDKMYDTSCLELDHALSGLADLEDYIENHHGK